MVEIMKINIDKDFNDKDNQFYKLNINGLTKSDIISIINALNISLNKNNIHSSELFSTEKSTIQLISGQIQFVLNQYIK